TRVCRFGSPPAFLLTGLPVAGHRKRNWLIGIAAAVVIAAVSMIIAGRILAARFEPYIKDQAIQYLQKRFNSDVEITALHVYLPHISPLKLALQRGRGAVALVEGEGISLRRKGVEDQRPVFVMKNFAFEVDLGRLFDEQKTVRSVTIDGMEINIPPKGQRPKF